jgi:hypothetical protein
VLCARYVNLILQSVNRLLLRSILLYKALYSESHPLMTSLQAACTSTEGSILGSDVWEILMFLIQSYEEYNGCVTSRGRQTHGIRYLH